MILRTALLFKQNAQLSRSIFHLYLLFLNPQLSLLAGINKWLLSVSDETNLCDMNGFLANVLDGALQKQLSDCEEHALISSSELQIAKMHMYRYILSIGKALKHHFPELDFIVHSGGFRGGPGGLGPPFSQ